MDSASRQSSVSLTWKSDSSDRQGLYHLIKRLFDLMFAGVGLLLLAPVGLVVALLIKLSDGGPVFYTQPRVGQFGRLFKIRKFRSMIVGAESKGASVTPEDDARITRLGHLLRRTKLDELPQLWNVLTGEMSLVGPRPEVPRYVEGYTLEQREILRFKPGITDMATLLFRNEEQLLRGSSNVEGFYRRYCVPKKFALNREYAERASLLQDIWIILQTLCPYWLGVFTVYGLCLLVSLWLAFQLRFDFQMTGEQYRQFARFLPGMLVPQMILLFWRGQFRGLMSYFSIPEMRQTVTALVLALVPQIGLWGVSGGRLAPTPGLIIIHFLVSFLSLCSVRMLVRFARERALRKENKTLAAVRHVAIIGIGETATNLALELNRNGQGRQVVAFFDDDPHSWHKRPHDIPVVGMPECLLHREWQSELDEVIVALSEEESARAREILNMLKGTQLKISVAAARPLLQPAETPAT